MLVGFNPKHLLILDQQSMKIMFQLKLILTSVPRKIQMGIRRQLIKIYGGWMECERERELGLYGHKTQCMQKCCLFIFPKMAIAWPDDGV